MSDLRYKQPDESLVEYMLRIETPCNYCGKKIHQRSKCDKCNYSGSCASCLKEHKVKEHGN